MSETLSRCIEWLNRCGEAFWSFAGVMFVQATVLVLVLLALELLLRNRVRAVVRYWLWLLVLVKLVLPVDLHTPASVAYWLPTRQAEVLPQTDRATDGRSFASEVARASPIAARSEPSDSRPNRDARSRTESIPFDDRADSKQPTKATPPVPSATLPNAPRLDWRGALFGLWTLAVAVLLALVGRRAVWVRRIVRQATGAPRELEDQLRDGLSLLGMTKCRVALIMTDRLGSPAICGLWRPTILLPCTFPAGLDREQIRMVFVHELVHWRRGDLQLNCCQTLLQILYFYNPAVWIANLIIRRLREQAVDETVLVALRGKPERYASTLLDIASGPLHPAEATLRLIGVVESGRAISTRIKRIVGLPIPKTSKLGLPGLLLTLLVGIAMLPMAGKRSLAAPKTPDTGRTSGTKPTAATDAQAPTARAPAVGDATLDGTLIDETGKPVTDATVELISRRTFRSVTTKSDENGKYQFAHVKDAGEYKILINSKRWVGLIDRSAPPHVDITPQSQVVRDFVLPRACRLRIQTVDERGEPVRGVQVYTSLFSDNQNFAGNGVTDQQGWASLDGLRPSVEQRLVATMSDGYAVAHFTLTLNDPTAVVERPIVLRRGEDVKGNATCSDGKPPAGWRINAKPTWWRFGVSPRGQVIGVDGSFTLPHVVADKYDVIVSIPIGGQMSMAKPVITAVVLPSGDKPLAVTVDYPSPASMAAISGQIEVTGGTLQRGFHIFARSTTGTYQGDTYVLPGQQEFKIGPVPRGTYTLEFESTEIESLLLRDVVIPSDKLHVKLKARGTLSLRGAVVRQDTGKPVTQFRAQVTKLRTLSGPNYVQEPTWHEFKDDRGAFAIDVAGPGIYTVLIAADDLASSRSEPFNTDKDGDREIRIELKPGISLLGTVVDEQGQAVDGAKIISLPNAVLIGGNVAGQATAGDEVAEARGGTFTIPNFTPGQGLLKVVHRDFSPSIVENVKVDHDGKAAPLKIILRRGAIVHGHVYDEFGRPESNVAIHFQNRSGYSGTDDEKLGQLASAVTDQSGYYEVQHLSDQFCYVKREDPWRSWGVVRQAILPANGKTQTLDLGGTTKMTGRLIVNGAPLANARVQLSDENPNFGIFKAFARTHEHGTFTFFGPAPGEHTLYYTTSIQSDSWVRVKDLTVTSNGGDLGALECVNVRLAVRIEPPVENTAEGMQVTLQEYNSVWPFGNTVGTLLQQQQPHGSVVFEQVPLGKFELICYRPNQFIVRKIVEITSTKPDQAVTLELPHGTASLSGKLAGTICGPDGCRSLKVWSKDQQLLGNILPKEDGTYRLENIPAGDYAIKEHDTRDAETLLSVSLRDRESKILDITSETVASSTKPMGVAMVRVFSLEGVPIPGCEIRFDASEHPPALSSSQDGRLVYVGTPGTYGALIAFPGFTPIRRNLELKLVGKAGKLPEGVEVHFQLQPKEG